MKKSKSKICCLMGQTASGKTNLAIKLAEYLPFEIISVDSGKIYRGMDIGTAKPTPEQLRKNHHHLVDICDPIESYSAGQFYSDVAKKIDIIFAKGNIPLLVGGSMFYFWVIQHGISILPPTCNIIRKKVDLERRQNGIDGLYQRLVIVDPETAARISKNDAQRIQRSLEIFDITGKSLSELNNTCSQEILNNEFFNIALFFGDKDILMQQIRDRFGQMVAKGFVDEVLCLYNRGDLSEELPAIRTVGYRQIWQYLSGQISNQEMFNFTTKLL